MNRCFQTLLIVSTIGCSWLAMLALHESGHVLHGWLSGATVAAVHLPPLGFSRTDFAANPHPLFVAWGGPVWGCLFPLILLGGVRLLNKTICSFATRHLYLLAWLVGFCLIANGGYLLGGAFMPSGGADDGGVILQHGGTRWQLFLFGIFAVPLGLYFWNGLGPSFGFGRSHGRVDRTAAVVLAVVLVCTITALAICEK